MTAAVAAVFEENAGRVRLDIVGLDPGSQTLTVTRFSSRPHRSGTSATPYESNTVRGYKAVASVGASKTLFDYEYDPSDGGSFWSTSYRVTTDLGVDQSVTIRPVTALTWLKSVQHPASNRPIQVSEISSAKKSARRGIFPIVGSALPVVVTDIHTARTMNLILNAQDEWEQADLEQLLTTADTLFLQGPTAGPGTGMPGPLYLTPGDLEISRVSSADSFRQLGFDVVEVAAPDPGIVGVAWSYDTVKASYASYQALKDAWLDYAGFVAGPPPGQVTV